MSKLELEKLDQYLKNFILSIRKADGHEYEPSTLRDIVSSFQTENLKGKNTNILYQIMNSSTPEFKLSRDALKGKQKSLKKHGKGNKPNRTCPLKADEIDLLCKKGVLGAMMQKAY